MVMVVLAYLRKTLLGESPPNGGLPVWNTLSFSGRSPRRGTTKLFCSGWMGALCSGAAGPEKGSIVLIAGDIKGHAIPLQRWPSDWREHGC